MEIYERIRLAMSANGYRQKDMVKLTGIPKSQFSRLLHGEWKKPDKHIATIAKVLGVNEYWLRTGLGKSVAIDHTLEVTSDQCQEIEINNQTFESLKSLVDDLLPSKPDIHAKYYMLVQGNSSASNPFSRMACIIPKCLIM